MPDEKKKMISSKETGTVPKVKYWNNTSAHPETHVSNNLTSPMLSNHERSQFGSRNRQRCTNFHCFEGLCAEETRIFPEYLPYLNMSDGTTSPSTSSSTSRRHSGNAIRKCDNITKYPDKKQIEDKLNQIREYLKVTSTLMSSAKEDQSSPSENEDLFQMLSALRDSEKKLEALLVAKEISGAVNSQQTTVVESEEAEHPLATMAPESVFPTFQNKIASQHNELQQKMEISEKKIHALHEHQTLLMQLQEKAENQLKDARKAQERLAACAKSVPFPKNTSQSELSLIPPTNEGRRQLFRLLDARDNELCAEQHLLQQKLQELSSKKMQIDQLVSQLHNCGGEAASEDGDDMANQIRQIVAMKEQLATLKDMLSAVKSTEASLQQQNSIDRSEISEQTATKPENLSKSRLSDVDARSDTSRKWSKNSNKSSISSSREQLQAELQAKKQELEELMYKDQDRTSAINRDVCSELVMNKHEQSFSLDSVPSSWTLLQDNSPPRESCVSRENGYSSDEEELENYSQMNNSEATKPSDYTHSNFTKQIPSNINPHQQDCAPSPSTSQNFTPQFSTVDHKQQLELMTSLCQSLLEQQRQILPTQCSQPNFQWFMSYMQMQQALMLSTISQCCQLLWIQQQDINSLVNTVTMMQRSKPPESRPQNESIASACSLPTRLPSNNTEYVRDRASPQNLTRNLHQVWTTAPALNNQVAPGNRANNYWDNFRSYSRQNLLSTSTKSNEDSQNSVPIFDRSNTSGFLSQPSTLPKINTPIHEGFIDQGSQRETDRVASRKTAKRNRGVCRNRNEWSEENPQENSPQKSKLFEVLRENVYKEVTLLISANEARPHFLIQLFRDLQHISSDPLRRSALQSIQSLISRSFSRNKPEKIEKLERSQSYAEFLNKLGNFDAEMKRIFLELDLVLKAHDEEVFHEGVGEIIKLVVLQLLPMEKMVSNNKLQAKLETSFSDSFQKFQGKRTLDIKEDLLKTIADILSSELPPITSVNQQNTKPPPTQPETISNSLLFLGDHGPSLPFEPFPFLSLDQRGAPPFSGAPRVDNGDLAEADQSRRDAENEEGAVGGLLVGEQNGESDANGGRDGNGDLGVNGPEVCLH